MVVATRVVGRPDILFRPPTRLLRVCARFIFFHIVSSFPAVFFHVVPIALHSCMNSNFYIAMMDGTCHIYWPCEGK